MFLTLVNLQTQYSPFSIIYLKTYPRLEEQEILSDLMNSKVYCDEELKFIIYLNWE